MDEFAQDQSAGAKAAAGDFGFKVLREYNMGSESNTVCIRQLNLALQY